MHLFYGLESKTALRFCYLDVLFKSCFVLLKTLLGMLKLGKAEKCGFIQEQIH